MKNITKILFTLIILGFLLGKAVLAIEPFKEEPPSEVPPGAQPEEVEVLEEAKDVTKKETNIKIERSHPQEVTLEELVEISLKITNLSQEKVNIFVTEAHKAGLEYPDPIEIKKLKYQGLTVPYYSWELPLEAGEETEIKYHLKSKKLGMILFSPAIINDDYGNTFESPPTTLKITCTENKTCDLGENYIFCSKDCQTGSSDNVCDGVEDGRCDPDCLKGADPDCKEIRKAPNYLYLRIGAVLVLVIFAAILILRFSRRKLD